jgi:hypothetical protein
MNRSPVAALVRGWVDLYTRGLPAEMRAARRDEVDDDLWCQHQEAVALGRPAHSLGADMLHRLLFGLPADISWRLSYRGPAPASLDQDQSTNTRDLGVPAIVAGSTYGILLLLFIPFSHAVWEGPGGVFGMAGTLVGSLAFLAAGVGLASRFQDRLGMLGSFGSLVLIVGALTSFTGFIVPLVVGSAMLMWDLARLGVVRRLVPIVQLVSAIAATALALAQPDLDDAGNRAFLAAAVAPFLVTWVVIGVSMLRGEAAAEPAPGG